MRDDRTPPPLQTRVKGVGRHNNSLLIVSNFLYIVCNVIKFNCTQNQCFTCFYNMYNLLICYPILKYFKIK